MPHNSNLLLSYLLLLGFSIFCGEKVIPTTPSTYAPIKQEFYNAQKLSRIVPDELSPPTPAQSLFAQEFPIQQPPASPASPSELPTYQELNYRPSQYSSITNLKLPNQKNPPIEQIEFRDVMNRSHIENLHAYGAASPV